MLNLKSQRGITLAVLIITIVILIILSAVAIRAGTDSTQKTRLQAFYTQLEIIQKRVDDVASTNESYIDDSGSKINIKEQGGKELTDQQKGSLQKIIQSENLGVDTGKFRYFTIEDLENLLDLMDMEYNVFIDFEDRIIVAEDGIRIGSETYYVLENATYFVEQNTNKNKGTIQSLTYTVTQYGKDNYKVTVTPSNTIGDLVPGNGSVQYKLTTTKYWETSTDNAIILQLSKEYNIIYQDVNKNKIEKTIKVDASNSSSPTVIEVTK